MQETVKGKEIIERMFSAGAHFAYSKTRRHPTVSPYIFGVKNRVEIFDLEKTSELLERAKSYVAELGAQGKTILFVGTKSEAADAVRRGAEALGQPYQTTRWSGGILTNFTEIRKRLNRLEELRSQRESGELERKYTKKERLLLGREINRLEASFQGIVGLRGMPDAVFVIDTRHERIAITEATKKKIPVIGLANSDCDLTGIAYPIVGNDATLASISFVVDELVAAYKEGLKRKPITPDAPKE